MSPIYNLESKTRAQRAKKGFVSVYSVTREGELVFSHHDPVNSLTHTNKLFVVRVVRWDPALYHAPLGVVLGVLPQGDYRNYILNKTEITIPYTVKFIW